MTEPILENLVDIQQESKLVASALENSSTVLESISAVNLCSLNYPSACSYDKLSEILEKVESDSSYFTKGVNLSLEHKKMIQPGDIWKISLIEEVPSCCRDHIGESFKAVGFKHYMNLQTDVWFSELTRQFRLKVNREPSDRELIGEFEKYGVGEKYKLCYILSFPRKITLDCEEYSKNRYCADSFLACAELLSEKIFGDSFPFWDIINANTTVEKLGA